MKTILPRLSALFILSSFFAQHADAAPRRYALTMMHFNVQYVAGGMVGFTPQLNLAYDLDEAAIEDMILVESFEPILDLLMAHPTWAMNLELQAYALDVMGDRHPQMLDKLRTLAKRNQVGVVSFHYGDQLFIAYPKEDWRRSAMLVRDTFARHDIPLSTAVFCQEGQASLGMLDAMPEFGYRTLVWPRNLRSYQLGDVPVTALMKRGEAYALTTNGTTYDDGADGVEVTWTFVDDGEVLATGGADPYFTTHFVKSDEAVAKYESSVAALEAQGFTIATVEAFMTAEKDRIPNAPPPELLDGTWQPSSTNGVARWLGGAGAWLPTERDNDVRTLGAIAHRELQAAETAARVAGLDVTDELSSAYRLLALGQVSDATGINPFRGEIEYGIAHFTEILRIARGIVNRSKAELGLTSVAIDTSAGTVVEGAGGVAGMVTPPFEVVINAGDREVKTTWLGREAGVSSLRIEFGAGIERSISVSFPSQTEDLFLTRALTDAPVRFSRADFRFEQFQLALPDGLVGLTPGKYVIKDQANTHIAAQIDDQPRVLFHDDTAPIDEKFVWSFLIVEGDDAKAADVAKRLNVLPTVIR